MKDEIMELAFALAYDLYDEDYYDLSDEDQTDVWTQAEEQYWDKRY